MISISDKDTAERAGLELRTAFDACGRALIAVREGASADEAQQFQEKIGDIFYILIFKLMEPLYYAHPELRPEDWDDRPPMDPE